MQTFCSYVPKQSLDAALTPRFATESQQTLAKHNKKHRFSAPKSQFYESFARSTRTILRMGCAQHAEITILRDRHARFYRKGLRGAPQICNFITVSRDHMKGLRGKQQNHNFTSVSHDRQARFYERVAVRKHFPLWLDFCRSAMMTDLC